ncbi:hypothetical protein HDU84_007724 [Entophlyctis sp. JEL0112]|nr:hypothetical protein HDU84_007724 [Entophlyctis sp. JEL0112]
MVYITSRLGLNFTLLRPGFIGELGMREGRANDIINDGFVAAICAAADVIIIADTLPDARPILQSLLKSNPAERCRSKIVVELTNRFDWGVYDFDQYHQLIWEVTQAKPENLFWVANNAFEAKVMADDCNATPEFRILRPSGHSDVPEQDVSEEARSKAMMRELDKSEVLGTMLKMKIPFTRVVGHYGGPKTLAKYKAYIEFPYQVSTMKFYENLAAGVHMLIPSPKFFKELIESRIHAFGPWEMLRRMGPDWYRHMDYFIPEFSPYVQYFNSFEHLKEILEDPQFESKSRIRKTAPIMYQNVVTDVLNGWAELFEEMGFKVLVDGKPRREVSGIQKFSVPAKYPQPADINGWKVLYQQIKSWKEAQREEQNMIWEENEKKLTNLQQKIKQAAKENRIYQFIKDEQISDDSEFQYRVLDYLHDELGKQAVFGGSLIEEKTFELTTELSQLLGLFESEKNLRFEPSDFIRFGYLARFFHAFHSLKVKSKSDPALAEKISPSLSKIDDASQKLTRALYPWLPIEDNQTIDSVWSSFSGRGIVFTFPTSGYARGVHLILTIRNILKCDLPIEIFYIGDKDLSPEKRESLEMLPGVKTIDIKDRFPRVENVFGFNIKPFVILASSFREVIFMDDDVTLLQSPNFFVNDSKLFKKYGTMYFLDRSFSRGNSEWVRSILPMPSLVSEHSRYMTDVSRDEQESSLIVLDKGRLPILHALLCACHMNLKESRDGALHVHTHGDKESFWIAHELVRAPYEFVPGIGGAAGFFRTKDGVQEHEVICGPQSHVDEKGRLLHFNGLVLKQKDSFSEGYLEFHHFVAPVRENPGNVDIGYHPWCVHSRVPEKEVFEIIQSDKETLDSVIKLHKELVEAGFNVTKFL